MREIYFDHGATTPVCPEAAAKLNECLTDNFGNPSSRHTAGRRAAAALAQARRQVLASLSVEEGSVVFCSGGTEANNLAIFGRVAAKERFAGGKILTTAGEHASVEAPLAALAARGFEVVRIPTRGGALDLDALRDACDRRVFFVSMMAVNNETGAVYDIREAAKIVHEKCPDALFHTDATQAYLKIPCSPVRMGADMMTLSGHKIGAPKGVGALWLSPAVIKGRGIAAVELGGGQETGLRSGTENMPGICAFGAAAEAGANALGRMEEVAALRAYLIQRLSSECGGDVSLHLPPQAAPHILSLALRGLPSETLLNFLSERGVYVSAGSACSSNARHARTSPALTAFGLSETEAASTVRVSLAPSNTREEADVLVSLVCEAAKTLYRKGRK